MLLTGWFHRRSRFGQARGRHEWAELFLNKRLAQSLADGHTSADGTMYLQALARCHGFRGIPVPPPFNGWLLSTPAPRYAGFPQPESCINMLVKLMFTAFPLCWDAIASLFDFILSCMKVEEANDLTSRFGT